MQTDTVFACNIENNDHIVIGGDLKGYVYSIDGEGDGSDEYVILDVVDEDGEHTQYPFPPFAMVTVVTSFLDEDSTDGEDVFIDV